MKSGRSIIRFAGCVLLIGVFLWLTMSGGHGQVRIIPGVPGGGASPGDSKDKEARPGDEFLTFWFPYDRDAKSRLQAARDYLANKDVDWTRVCFALQSILDAKSDSFFDYEYKAGEETKVGRISVKAEANRIISTFNRDGLQFYQQTYGPAAAALLKEAIDRGYDIPTLSDVSQRFFHTRAGAEATILLGTIHLDRGNFLEAAYAFDRLLSRPESDEFLTPRTLFKAALALRRSGDSRHASLSERIFERLSRQLPRAGLTIGRRIYTVDDLKRELERPVAFLAATATDWAMRYGNPQRNAVAKGGAPFLVPVFKPFPMLYHLNNPWKFELRDGAEWVRQNLTHALRQLDQTKDKRLALPGFFPLTAPGLLIFRSYDGIYAITTQDRLIAGRLVPAGELLWFSSSQYGIPQLVTHTEYRNEVNNWWRQYLSTRVESLLFENPLLGCLSHDGQNVYAVDDLAVPPPPMLTDPNFGGFQPVMPTTVSKLSEPINSNILTAMDLQTGKVVWTLGGRSQGPPLTEEEEDRATSADVLCQNSIFLGPPLPLNGRLYVLAEREGRVRLHCLDPRTLVKVPGRSDVPALVWSQRLGEPINRLPGDSIRRFQGALLAGSEGIIVCPTNSGAVIGVDAMSRSLLWAYSYRKQDTPDPSRQPGVGRIVRRPFPVPGNNNISLASERWHAAAPIIANGRVIFAAYDSNSLDCLDLRTGKLLWSVPRESTDLYVGGVSGDKVVVVGKEDIRAYRLTGEDPDTLKPQLAWGKTKINTPSGHGVIGDSVYYLPVRPDNTNREDSGAEIWCIDLTSGQILSKTVSRKPDLGLDPMLYGTGDMALIGAGNLVFHEGLVVTQSPWSVSAFPDLEMKRAEMDRRLAANPHDPVGLRDRGELLMDEGKLLAAVKDFKAAAANQPSPEIERTLKLRLYQAYTELLRKDFTAGEPFLKEYEQLCEVSLNGIDDPTERARAAEENQRRRGLFLSLVAKGREKQGQLVEAFERYMEFAQLGGNRQLVSILDEPNMLMRPDVWARSRIEAMLRSAQAPSVRKPLEDRVRQEWERLKETQDLAALRRFVDVFGPYFPEGAKARLKLADRLTQTGQDDDSREAQTLLAQLRVTAEDPSIRAKATELLARVLIRAGLLEDAVALYAQLGQEYASIIIRDGKTGADFFTDLLTDKRLLPYLEPSRHSWPGRVKAEQREPSPTGIRSQSFTLEPEGELLPFYRRFRLVMDIGNGAAAWTLRVHDRVTGEERCKFPGLRQVQMTVQNPNVQQPQRFVLANGHLLLVHLGHWAYCLDLAERRMRWEYNLLGEFGGNAPPQADLGPDGEVVLRFEDGFMLTLGRSAVLQPHYACLLTRDELVALDPLSGRKLWARRNVSGRTQVYGDSQYVLLVETGPDKKAVSTQLLRAADGSLVENYRDVTRLLTSAKFYRVFGRRILLVEQGGVARLHDLTTGTDVWKQEFGVKAIPVKTQNADWVGFVQPSGVFTLLDSRTGQKIGGGVIDEKYRDEHLKNCVEAILLSDQDRFFLFLERDPNTVPAAMRNRIYYGPNHLRTLKVNGPVYCFDRSTGKRLWFADKLFENQTLIMEQFSELPVIVAAAQVIEENNQYRYRVVIVEKESGKLRFYRGLPYDGNSFVAMQTDPRNGRIELLKYNLRIVITPDDDDKTAMATTK